MPGMAVLRRCKVINTDGILPDVDGGGIVTILGESPNATVRVAAGDLGARRWTTVDRLTRCKVTERRGVFTIEGQSDYLRNHIGTSGKDSLITVEVTPGHDCEDCPK